MLLGFNLLLWSTHVTEDLFPILTDIKRAGYDGVELPIFEGSPEHFRKIGDAARNDGLRVTGVAVIPDSGHDCASADPAVRAAALSHIKWAVDCLEAAGGEVLSGPFHQPLGVFTGVAVIPDSGHDCASADPAVRAAALSHVKWAVDCLEAARGEVLSGPFHQPLGVFTGDPPTEAELANVADVHRAAAGYAARSNIKLSIEPLNRFECYVLNTVADAAKLVRAVNAPNYGLLYDTFHSNIEEKDPVGVIAPNLALINHVHFSENDRGTPGKGHVPWAPTMKALKQGGYQGWCVIEAFGRALPALAAATRVWRDFFPHREEVYRFGHDFLRRQWEAA